MDISWLDIASYSNSTVTVLYWAATIGFIAGLIFFIYWWTSHKVLVIIRKVAGDRTITRIDRARIIKKQGHAVKWKLRKTGGTMPIPPKEALDVTEKGKTIVECYLTEDNEFHFIEDRGIHDQLGSLHPIKSVDKEFYANEVREGLEYKKKSIGEILLQLAPYMIVVMILVLFMVFFDQAISPTISIGEQLIAATDNIKIAMEAVASCTQTVGTEILPVPN